MKATALLATLVLGILVAPLAATAQPAGKVHRIGWLFAGSPSAGVHALLEAFRQGLHDLGYVEGRNMRIESRYAESQEDRLPALAAELVRLPVDVLVAAGTTAIQAAQHATTTPGSAPGRGGPRPDSWSRDRRAHPPARYRAPPNAAHRGCA